MHIKLETYKWSMGILGLASSFFVLPPLWHSNVLSLILVFLVALLIESSSISLGSQLVLSAIPLLFLGVLVTYSAPLAIGLLIFSQFVGPTLRGSKLLFSWRLFNAGQYALCAIAAAYIFRASSAHSFLGVALAATAFFILNQVFLLILGVLSQTIHWHAVFKGMGLELLLALVSVPYAWLMDHFSRANPSTVLLLLVLMTLLGKLGQLGNRLNTWAKVQRFLFQKPPMDYFEAVQSFIKRISPAETVSVYLVSPHMQVVLGEAIPGANDLVVESVSTQRVVYQPHREKSHSLVVFPFPDGALVCYAPLSNSFASSIKQGYLHIIASHLGAKLQHERYLQQLTELSMRDALTGLYNRRHFQLELRRPLDTHAPVHVMVIDLDHFKAINDTYGHQAGDAVLKAFAELLTKHIPIGLVARYGGEEFALLLSGTLQEAQDMGAVLLEQTRKMKISFRDTVISGLTFSAGIASSTTRVSENPYQLYELADAAMYWGAKMRGRDRIALYHADLNPDLYVDSESGFFTHDYVTIYLSQQLQKGITHWGVGVFPAGQRWFTSLQQMCRESLWDGTLLVRYTVHKVIVICPFASQEAMQRAATAHCLPEPVYLYISCTSAEVFLEQIHREVVQSEMNS